MEPTQELGDKVLSPAVRDAAESFSDRDVVAATEFAAAVLDLADTPPVPPAAMDALTSKAPPTGGRPVAEWLADIDDVFVTPPTTQLDVVSVLIGLAVLDSDLRHTLESGGHLDTLVSAYPVPLADVLAPGYSLFGPADSVPTQPDRPVTDPSKDHLQRVAFAEFLAHRLDDVSSDRAYALNLYGAWGSGKTTLLNFLEAELTERSPSTASAGDSASTGADVEPVTESPTGMDGSATGEAAGDQSSGSGADAAAGEGEPWQVVRFNAWQHQHVDPPWWALMDHVYQQSKHLLSLRARASEFWWRFSSGRIRFLAGIAAMAWLLGLAIPAVLAGWTTFQGLAGTADALGKLFGVAVTAWAAVEAFTSSLLGGSTRAAESYVETVSDPMNTIESRFETLIERIPRKVAIFIDDLDRCEAAYVVGLLEGIQTLFADAAVVFVVAADRDWIEVCFDESFADQADAVDEPGRSLGGLFLEKTFQFSTPVPIIPEELQAEYWSHLLDVDGEQEQTSPPAAASDALADAASEDEILSVVDEAGDRSFAEEQSIREAAVARLAAPEIVERTEHLLSPLATLLEPNPRAMKRLVNAYSVNRALVMLGRVDVDREPLALWTILCIQYPAFAKYLADNPDAVSSVGDAAPDDAGPSVAPLFTHETVERIVGGDPVDVALTPSSVEACARVRP